ncbi:helix-turn-helix transcriptional regulator, partial [Klebsiella pneumoniae]
MLIIRNILKAYAFNVLHFKCMTTFTIAMTMPDILINTENIFLNRGICELGFV